MEKVQIISNVTEIDILKISQPTMSSLQIAKLTGKQHKHIMADIRTMIDALGLDSRAENSAVLETTYKASNGKRNRMYELNEELTLTLTSGYSIPQRNAIIKQWLMLRGDPIRSMYLHFSGLKKIEKTNGTIWGVSGNEQKKLKKSLSMYERQIIGHLQQELDLFSSL